MATTLAVHRPTWQSVDRFIALTDRIAEHLRDYGIPDERIVVKPNGLPGPGRAGPARRRLPLRAPGCPRRRASACCWTPGGGTRTASLGPLRIAGDGELRPLAEQAAAERADVTYLGVAGPGRDGRRPAPRPPWWSPCRPGTTCCRR